MPRPHEGTDEQELRDRVAASPFHAAMGISVAAVRRGEVELRLDAGEGHANLQGSVHGGVLATLLDTAAGLAVGTTIPPGSRHVTITLDVQYLAPGGTGRISSTGRVVRAGRRLAFAEADATAEDGTLLARAQLTVAVSSPAEPGVRDGSSGAQ